MNKCMEGRLTNLHIAILKEKVSGKLLIVVLGFLATVIIPFVHLGGYYNFWIQKPLVDKSNCTCSCFDTIFKGRYEWPPSRYKHVYFNTNLTTFKIWIIICLGVITCYEVTKKILMIIKSKCTRLPMLVLLLSSLYPHYFSWWNFFQYLNEEFYDQWYHQLFFTGTELLSTIMVFHLCDSRNKIEPWKLLFIFSLNITHIIVSSLDQFITNVFLARGQVSQIFRDIALMSSDLLHVFVACFQMCILPDWHNMSIINLLHRKEMMLSLLAVLLLSVLAKSL
ncbi:hypothetical protein HELRODRAFT_191581 [Helobdella robusta]|uniref:Uncharacterized protein n=1 Tax=Helobdella robusta TaxID=6412 RepID=T1FT37_HELRO|nr:hypothetical protein HELRODRAFT_191581 [Helobdella robusta]ESO05072.1 hypothetical protein HELRODRAFT_191581 [Helobdella robusta]